jgi:acyl phosphate:glycerol-3-phosphate acyltransferase
VSGDPPNSDDLPPPARLVGARWPQEGPAECARSGPGLEGGPPVNALTILARSRLRRHAGLLSNLRASIVLSWKAKSMSPWIICAIALLIAYLLGAIPTGYWAGKLLQGIDIQEHGSQSTGATNVLRTLGKGPAIAVLLMDVLKGAAAIAVATFIGTGLSLEWLNWLVALAGLAAVLGHARSIWLRFSGGKSAATGLGVLLAMAWPVGLGAALVFGIVLALSRIVSLSSIAGALASIAFMQIYNQPLPYVLLAVAGGLYVILKHKTNIQRLIAGTEPRIGKKQPEIS